MRRVMLRWGQGAVGIVNDRDNIGSERGPGGFDKEDALVLTADPAPALIGDDDNGGNSGITIFGSAFEDAVVWVGMAGGSGAGTMTMGGSGGSNYAYADPARAILDDGGRHPLGPLGSLWRIQHGNHSCSRREAIARADRFVATHSNGTT